MPSTAHLAVLLVATAAAPAQALFTPLHILHPSGGQLAFDGQRILMATDGFQTGNGYFREIWALQGSTWSYVAPGPVDAIAMSYDTVRNRLVVLMQSQNVLLEWNGTTWSSVSMPGPLHFCRQWQLCWDPTRAATVVLGYDLTNDVCELWSYGTAGWQQLSSSPGPQYGTYRIVPQANGDFLWIGLRWSTLAPETWRWSASAWTPLAPPPGDGEAICDPVTLQPYLVSAPRGGNISIWTFNGVSWSLVANGPAVTRVTAVHDGQRIVIRGGEVPVLMPDGQTWSFQGGAFTQIGEPQPQLLYSRRAVFDTWRQRTLVVGLFNNNRETWEWDGAGFVLRDRTARPWSTLNLAFDELRGVSVLLERDGTTSEWNGVSWTTIGGAGFGPARPGACMAFDGQRVVLFGGYDEFTFQTWNQTRLYDGVAWTQWLGSSPPAAQGDSQLVHDPSRGRTVLIGGGLSSIYEWTGSGWLTAYPTPWTPASMPRYGFFAGFHPARGRVVFGGGGGTVNGGPANSVWEWNGAGLAAAPPKEGGGVLVREPGGDAVLFRQVGLGDLGLVDRMTSVYPATLTKFGVGCAGSVGMPVVTAEPWQAAWLGGTLQLRCATIPSPGVAFWVLGFSNTTQGGVPLPADLGILGAPGCSELVSLDWTQFAVASGGAVTLSLPVPLFAAGLFGQRAHAQVLVADPPANAAGFVVSDAMTFRVGFR